MKYKVGDRLISKLGSKIEIVEYGDCYYVCSTQLGNTIELDDEVLDNAYDQIEEPNQIGGNHYSKLKIDPYEYAMENNLNPLQMNAIKYITRYKDKNGIEDLKKALHTINRLIDYENRD